MVFQSYHSHLIIIINYTPFKTVKHIFVYSVISAYIYLPDVLSKDLSFIEGTFAVNSSLSGILFLPLSKLESHVTELSIFAKYASSQACICLGMYTLAIFAYSYCKKYWQIAVIMI